MALQMALVTEPFATLFDCLNIDNVKILRVTRVNVNEEVATN